MIQFTFMELDRDNHVMDRMIELYMDAVQDNDDYVYGDTVKFEIDEGGTSLTVYGYIPASEFMVHVCGDKIKSERFFITKIHDEDVIGQEKNWKKASVDVCERILHISCFKDLSEENKNLLNQYFTKWREENNESYKLEEEEE